MGQNETGVDTGNWSTAWVNPHPIGIAQPRRTNEFRTVRWVCRRIPMNTDVSALLPSTGLLSNSRPGSSVRCPGRPDRQAPHSANAVLE
jgi:hypothetical protein